MIKQFRGEYRWLSNFSKVSVVLNGMSYPTTEHAYMSEKSEDLDWKEFCSDPTNSPGDVKREGKKIKLVDDWNTKKFQVMREVLEQKFKQQPYKNLLRATGDEFIQEGNTWGDKVWGVDLKTGEGENHLGKMIMEIRSKL